MKASGHDKIKELFEAQKSGDRSEAPGLHSLLQSAPRAGLQWRRSWLPAGAMFVLLLIASAVLVIRLGFPPGVPPSLSEWRSPTGFLLGAGGGDVMGRAPRLGDSGYPTSALSVFAPSIAPRPVDRDSHSQKRESREDR